MGFSSKKKPGKKAKKNAAKAALTATSRVERVRGRAQQAALDGKTVLAGTVLPAVAVGARDARKKSSSLVDEYLPAVQDTVQAQGQRIAGLTDNLGPRAQQLRTDLQDDYLPRARRTADATNTVVAAAVAAAIDAARKELDKGQADIKKAYAKPTPKQRKNRAGKVLLVLTLAAAGAAGGYVAWKKSRPVEDPWAPPADFARAHYPASGATDTDSSEVSDTVGGAEAGDVARSLQGGSNAPATSNTKDRSSDTAPRDVKVDSASDKDASSKGTSRTGTARTGAAAAGSSSATSASGTHADSTGTHRGEDLPEQGKVIDPVMNPEENPADPDRAAKDDKRGTHRGDA